MGVRDSYGNQPNHAGGMMTDGIGVIMDESVGDVFCAHCGLLVDLYAYRESTVVMTSRDSAFIIHNPCLEEMHTRAFILDSEARVMVIRSILEAMTKHE